MIGEEALEELGAYARARRWSQPLVVMDVNTREALGWRVLERLANEHIGASALEFPERSGLLADEQAVSRLESALGDSGADVLMSVGSGVITDLTRYVANRSGLHFVSVPTAASMDGYASGVAAMEFGGMKTTFSSVAPVAIFADPVTVAAAPRDMTRSGLGDLLGKASSRVDWRIAHGLYGEAYCPEVERRVSDPFIQAATGVDDILRQSPDAIAQLLHGLIESGIAMAMMGSSRPASGCEHHASHLWDLLAADGRRQHAPHGLQVGYATQFAMRLQEFAFGAAATPGPPRQPDPYREGAHEWLHGHAAEVRAVLADKRRWQSEHESHWPATEAQWEAIQQRAVEGMDTFPLVRDALRSAAIPSEPGYLDLDVPTLKTTFRLANRMRARYTTLDFLEGQGKLDHAIDAIIS